MMRPSLPNLKLVTKNAASTNFNPWRNKWVTHLCRRTLNSPSSLRGELQPQLINHLQSQLNLPRCRRCGGNQSRRRTDGCSREQDRIWRSEVRVVQGIEEFRSKL